MSTGTPNLRNRAHFPSFLELPDDEDIPSDYYQPDIYTGVYHPRKHWCFFAEIIKQVPWPFRPMYRVRDVVGRELLVAFHLEDRVLFPHYFADGQVGIRVEAEEMFTICDSYFFVFPYNLKTLLSMSDKIQSTSTACSTCGKDSNLRCVHCHARYCDKKCQTADWKQGHKKECPMKCQIMGLGSFDWKRFDRFRRFQVFPPFSGHLV
ncbi:hypothetical protein BD779DRAFT_1676369 [Infundibulicybe gibba]|nr:hypothetical protein BD779DRAFT_1676369 [Infundibulicybe gibba]